MIISTYSFESQQQAHAVRLLQELGIPCHLLGYQQLCIALPSYAQNSTQSLSKELYPIIAEQLLIPDWRAVEHAMRSAILHAWLHGDPTVWKRYFPRSQKAPSNKIFLATLSEYLKYN